jgi:hypothetical protein
VPDKQSGSSVCDVADPSLEPVLLPVGFEKFNRRGFLNYQFNRAQVWDGLMGMSCGMLPRAGSSW